MFLQTNKLRRPQKFQCFPAECCLAHLQSDLQVTHCRGDCLVVQRHTASCTSAPWCVNMT